MGPDDAPERVDVQGHAFQEWKFLEPPVDESCAGVQQHDPTERGGQIGKQKRHPKHEFETFGKRDVSPCQQPGQEDSDREGNGLIDKRDLYGIPQGDPQLSVTESLFPCREAIDGRIGDGRDVETVDENQEQWIEDIKTKGAYQKNHEEEPQV